MGRGGCRAGRRCTLRERSTLARTKSTPLSSRSSGEPMGAGKVSVTRAPFAGRVALPVVECPGEGMGVLVAQEVRGLVELERRAQQVVAGQLAPRLLQQLLERRAVLGEPPLQRPGARAQLSRDVLDSRPPPGQQRFQDALDLLADRSRSE